MSYIDFLPLFSAIFVFILGLLVFLKNKKSKINFTFFLLTVTFTIWFIGTFMMFLNKNIQEAAIFWDRFVYIGVIFIPIFSYQFTLTYIQKKSGVLFYFSYFLSFCFLLLSRTQYFVNNLFIYKWGVHAKAQFCHHLFLIYFVIYIIISFVYLLKFYKNLSSVIKKQQTKYIIISLFLLSSIGSLAFLPAYGIGIYPFAYISGVIFTVITAYAIVRYRLMDIKIIIRKSTVYLASFFVILILAVCIRSIFSLFFAQIVDWVNLIILIISISLFSPIKYYFYKIANKYFFTSLYDSQEIISEISDKLRTSLQLNQIYNFIYEVLLKAFHLEIFGFLNYNEKTGIYSVLCSNGIGFRKQQKIQSNPYLHKIFIEKNQPIITEEIKNTHYNENTKEFIDLLSDQKIEVLVPLNIKEQTVGLLALGQKESKDIYNDEDFRVLQIISSQAAIAIENSLLFEKIQNFNIQLKKEIKKATQDLVVANQKLTRVDQAKSEFISIASHQLRTPITVIKGYVSMVLAGDFGKLEFEQENSLKKVYESSEQMMRLVNNLLNISRIEAERLEFNYEIINLEQVVSDIVNNLQKILGQKKICLKYIKPSEQLPLVKIDQQKIKEVIANLIENAIKYTVEGNITVSLKVIDQNIQFGVSDSGVGICKDDIPKLFKKFSRGETMSRIHTEGTGLGLYVARKMIEAHQGKIWVESEGENKGSQFYFQLPIVQ